MKNKRGILKSWIILAIALIAISLITLVIALTDDEAALENELNNLISDLNNQGYSWLTDYNINIGGI